MVYQSEYGGELLRIPLRSLLKRGRGDDVFVVVDKENHSKYGVLGIDRNVFDYDLALKMAADWHTGEPMMVAVEDPESGSPMMLTKELNREGVQHFLAVIFNARFADDPEENGSGSFCLRLSGALDPNSKVSERIVYSPGEHIEWSEGQLQKIFDLLSA